MANTQAQATAIINGLEMFARTHGFGVEHGAFIAQPNEGTRTSVFNRIYYNDLINSTVESHLRGIYHYYMRLAEEDFDYDYMYGELCDNYKSFVQSRFPSAQDTRRRFANSLRDALESMNNPQQRVADLARVLRNHRPWFNREWHRSNGEMHPAVFKAWAVAEPADWHQLVMEWPHVSKQGAHMVAYTRDEKYGEADRQLAGTVPKYLTRHFPKLPSNVIRDISGMYVEAKFGIVRTMPEMLDIIKNGPPSCMGGQGERFRDLCGRHPYEAYDPEHGWHMAYVKEGSRYTGRALLNDEYWVRTYRSREGSTSYSDTDERLNSWLREQGYRKARDWVGFSLKRIDMNNDCGFLAPYLDGDNKDVEATHTMLRIVNEGDGDYHCSNTDGDADIRNSCTCDCCGARMSEDDTYSVGRGDTQVCSHCYDNEYTVVYGRRGDQYAVPNSEAIEFDGEGYHTEWLSDNDIVELYDGEYCRSDDAVWVESEGAHYPADDERVVYTQDGEYEMRDNCIELENGEWCLEEDAWQCAHSGDWYANDDVQSAETKCGKHIHPDHAEHYVLVTTE
jgi:hypothetical protein